MLIAQRDGHVGVSTAVEQLGECRTLLGVHRQAGVAQVVESERRAAGGGAGGAPVAVERRL